MPSTTARGFRYPLLDRSETPDVPRDFKNLADDMDAQWTTVANPGSLPSFGVAGRMIWAQSNDSLWMDTGSSWVLVGRGNPGPWRTLVRGSGSLNASLASTGLIPLSLASGGSILPVSSTTNPAGGTTFYFAPSDYAESGKTLKFRLRLSLHTTTGWTAQDVTARLQQVLSWTDTNAAAHAVPNAISSLSPSSTISSAAGAQHVNADSSEVDAPSSAAFFVISLAPITMAAARMSVEVELAVRSGA